MKIFGREITWGSKEKVIELQDAVPEIDFVVPEDKKPASISRIVSPVIGYNEKRQSGRGDFRYSEYNLAEVGRIEDTDSYVRQAFDKKVALMFKEGWDLVGPNPRTVKYIKARLTQISQATDTPTEKLLRDIGSGLIRKSNSFVVKVRKSSASGGRIRLEPGKTKPIEPVAGYFIVPAETLLVQKSGNRIVKWKQKTPNGDYSKEWMPRDVVHFYYDRKDGFVFGTPTLTPVTDDIRALRKIEENIEMLIYQHLFPIFQYKVGTPESPATITETGEHEVDVVRREIQYMPTEGGIVTTERHEISAIGAEGRAIRAESYVEHFKKRVFSGLGVSAVDMGEGETANRATADNMSRNMVDGVKDFQRILELFFNHFIINELLLESTFGNDVLDEENRVYLQFKEIDIDAQIKKENHYADLFNKQAIDHDEARTAMGREPMDLPSPEEAQNQQDGPENYPSWNKTHWKMFQLPTLLIQAIDEPYSPLAEAVASDSSTSVTPQNVNTSRAKEDERIAAELKAKQASKQVASARKDFVIHDQVIQSVFNSTKDNTLDYIHRHNSLDTDWVGSKIRTEMTTAIDNLIVNQMVQYRNGYSRNADVLRVNFITDAASARARFRLRAERYINKLTENILEKLRANINDQQTPLEMYQTAREIFDTLYYRTKFIEDVEIRKAYTFGEAMGRYINGERHLVLKASEDGCATCLSKSRMGIDTEHMVLDDIPPYHANCTCGFASSSDIVDSVTDSDMIGTEDKE